LPHFCNKIGCHGNVLKISEKKPDWSSAIQYLPYNAKVVKIGPADPEILRLRVNKSGTTQYLVVMPTCLDRLENKVQIHHRHVKRFHMVKRLRKSVQYIRRYSTKYAESRLRQTMQCRLESSPPKLLDRSSPKFYTIFRHWWRYLIMHIHGVISLRFETTER